MEGDIRVSFYNGESWEKSPGAAAGNPGESGKVTAAGEVINTVFVLCCKGFLTATAT